MPRPVVHGAPDARDKEEPRAWLTQFGGAVGAGALGAVLAVAPAALRLQGLEGMCGALGTWTAAWAAALVPMIVAVACLQSARVGLASLVGADGATGRVTLLSWILACFAALTLLGALFREHTHHRALGGVFFAFAALFVALGLALFFARAAALTRRAAPATRWAIAAIGLAALALTWSVAWQRLSAGTQGISPAVSLRLVDGLAFVLAAVLASARSLTRGRALALAGPPVAAVVLLMGSSSLRGCPPLREALEAHAPLLSWVTARALPD